MLTGAPLGNPDGWGGQHPWDICFALTHRATGWPRPGSDSPVRHRRHRKRRCSSEIGCRLPSGSARRPNDPAVPGSPPARRDPHRSRCGVARRRSAACSITSRTHRFLGNPTVVTGVTICAIPCIRRRPARSIRGEQFPVPLGDDFDGAVDHFDGGLVVDRVRRTGIPAAHLSASAMEFSGMSS